MQLAHPKTLFLLEGRSTHGQLTSCGIGNPAISLRAGTTPNNTPAPGAPNTATNHLLLAEPTHQRPPLQLRYAHSEGSGIFSSPNLPSPLIETKMKLILQAEQIEANKANLHSHLSLAHSCSCIQSIKHQRCEKVTAGEAGTIRRALLSDRFDSEQQPQQYRLCWFG